MFACEECTGEYPSPWAAEHCADEDREQDRRNRALMRAGTKAQKTRAETPPTEH